MASPRAPHVALSSRPHCSAPQRPRKSALTVALARARCAARRSCRQRRAGELSHIAIRYPLSLNLSSRRCLHALFQLPESILGSSQDSSVRRARALEVRENSQKYGELTLINIHIPTLSHLYALHGFWGPPGLRFSMLLLSHGSWFGSCCPEWRRDPGREPPGFAGCSRFAIRGPQVLSLSPHHDSRAPLLSAWPARLARLAVRTTSVVSSECGSFIGHNHRL